MSKNSYHFLVVCLCGALVVSFQGCDQIQKFSDYLSPSRKPAQASVQSTQPPQQAPAASPASAEPKPVAVKAEASKPIAPNVLVKVGDWSMTIEEFNTQLQALEGQGVPDLDIGNIDQKKYILEQLRQQQILVQMAMNQKMDQEKNVVEAVKAFRDTILAQALVEKLVAGVAVTDEEVQEFYNQNKNDLAESPAQWHVKEIVVDKEDAARAIVVELNQGASFETIAKEKSIGKTAAQGGDLGTLQTFDGNEKMGQIVAALDEGEISGVFKGPQGFYIVKLVKKTGGEIPKLQDIQADLKNFVLMLKQQNVVAEAMSQAEAQIDIYINEKLLEE